MTFCLCVNLIRCRLHLCLRDFREVLLVLLKKKDKKEAYSFIMSPASYRWCLVLVSWSAGSGPSVSDAVVGAPAGLDRMFALSKPPKRTCFIRPQTILETYQNYLFETKEIIRLKTKCHLRLPKGEFLLSSLYSTHQFPVVSKVAITYPDSSWSIGIGSFCHFCSVDVVPCPPQESPLVL